MTYDPCIVKSLFCSVWLGICALGGIDQLGDLLGVPNSLCASRWHVITSKHAGEKSCSSPIWRGRGRYRAQGKRLGSQPQYPGLGDTEQGLQGGWDCLALASPSAFPQSAGPSPQAASSMKHPLPPAHRKYWL